MAEPYNTPPGHAKIVEKLTVHKQSGDLYWDGNKVETKSKLSLSKTQAVFAILVAIASIVGVGLDFYKSFFLKQEPSRIELIIPDQSTTTTESSPQDTQQKP